MEYFEYIAFYKQGVKNEYGDVPYAGVYLVDELDLGNGLVKVYCDEIESSFWEPIKDLHICACLTKLNNLPVFEGDVFTDSDGGLVVASFENILTIIEKRYTACHYNIYDRSHPHNSIQQFGYTYTSKDVTITVNSEFENDLVIKGEY